ncbi:hypothetical protein ES703_09326 [subsurface metagenome]
MNGRDHLRSVPKAMTKIFFASDIHGSELCFKKFINAAQFYGVDVIILGGDLTAKMVIPLMEQGGKYHASLFGRTETAETQEELKALEERIVANGFYLYRCDPDELGEILNSREKQFELFHRLILDSLKNWIGIAETRLAGSNIQCYIMAGNDDDPCVIEILNQSRVIVNPEFKKVELPGGYEMISIGYSNITPFESPREREEDELYECLVEQANAIKDSTTAIFNLHCPPHHSGLDTAPELTSDLHIVLRGEQPSMVPVGSTAVRRAIEEFQPLLGLHGHVHESRGAMKIGRTLCVNPGSEYAASVLRGVIVNLDGMKVKGYQFVSG